MEKNVLTPIKAVKKAIEAYKICGNTTQPTNTKRVWNTKGKTKLGDDFQAYCAIDVKETEQQIVYCCRNCNTSKAESSEKRTLLKESKRQYRNYQSSVSLLSLESNATLTCTAAIFKEFRKEFSIPCPCPCPCPDANEIHSTLLTRNLT